MKLDEILNKKEIILENESETKKIAKDILNDLGELDTIVLTGDLGTGKTKFVEGVLEKYNAENQISSPTFTIVNEYAVKGNDFKKIYHMDVYRLESAEEIFDAGIDECFGEGLCLIEWGEMIEEILSGKYLKITIKKIDTTNKRVMTVELKENN